MKVLLLENVKKIGQKGEIVEVADGYAGSFLIPRKLAKTATDQDVSNFKKVSSKKQEQADAQEQAEQDLFKRLNKKKIEIQSPANPSGHLFGAVGKPEIGSALPGLRADHIVLKQGIKEIGEYTIPIIVGPNKGHISLTITG